MVGLEGYTSIDEHVSSLMDADGCRAITEGCDAIATNQPVVPRGGDIKRLTGPALEHLRGLLDEVDKDRQHYGTAGQCTSDLIKRLSTFRPHVTTQGCTTSPEARATHRAPSGCAADAKMADSGSTASSTRASSKQ